MPTQNTRVRKITISMPGELVSYTDQLAERTHTSRSQVISRLLAEARARERERLGMEGYRFYAQEADDFAESSAEAVAEALAGSTFLEGGHDGETR